VKDRLGREIALEGLAVLHGRNLDFELLAQVGEALLFRRAPGEFVRRGEGSLRYRTHWFSFFVDCFNHPARAPTASRSRRAQRRDRP